MRIQKKLHRYTWLLTASLALSGLLHFAEAAEEIPSKPAAVAPANLAAAIAEYRQKLEEYKVAQQKYEEQAGRYWNEVKEKRQKRAAKRAAHEAVVLKDYVLQQPPAYSGPAEPVNPALPVPPPPTPPPRYIPVVADFLGSAKRYFEFVPQRPKTEIEFKRAYAKVAAAAGLTGNQAVRIYGFEAGGNGHYDVQAGLEQPKPDAHAISTALGYNQLLNTNSVELLAEQGGRFVKALNEKAATLAGAPKKRLENKIKILQSMIAESKTVPDDWSAHEQLANTPKGLGIHALNLDIDIGPLLQTQKLMDSVVFARRKGYGRPLTAAELEMMNLTGDGNGFDMVTMPEGLRDKVPTANFFQPRGYERNPVAIRNNTVAALIKATDAVMDREVKLQGAKDLASAFSHAGSR
jgi:hypothetical protein